VKKIFCVLATLLASSFTLAQPPGTHQSYVSLVRTIRPLEGPPIAQTICGGVVIDERRKLVATALHCVPNEQALLPSLSINGGAAKLVLHSADADMAIFEVSNLRGVKAPQFATPSIGQSISAFAYFDSFGVSPQGQSDHFFPLNTIKATLSWKGEVIAIEASNRRIGPSVEQVEKTGFKWITVSGNPTQGFSGGPMFDKNGKFVGIISNGNGGFTNVSSSENAVTLMKKLQ
jgi:hypothetical protein